MKVFLISHPELEMVDWDRASTRQVVVRVTRSLQY
jgi:hypothetical protein